MLAHSISCSIGKLHVLFYDNIIFELIVTLNLDAVRLLFVGTFRP